MTASCIYEGTIRHRRVAPRREFRHRLALWYVDLDELPELLDGRLLEPSPGALRFRRRDYHGDPRVPLAEAVRETVGAASGSRPAGPIRLLTQLRSYGHCFNPVSFYYCLSAGGDRVQAILAEVTNTPWRERHAYVLGSGREGSPLLVSSVDKAMHVSPFMPMDLSYTARATVPGRTLSVHMESNRAGARVFDATLSLSRRELTAGSARRLTMRYPAATVGVLALIYAQALRLRLAGAGVHPHPGERGR
ncbi:MAG: DUF1365 domain-containing protein [Solirubrobacteraceae bacterium]